ncbi:MAG: type II toxin-antitoxin system VapC family toxin [Euryarchaeota archaeon]|nr:type II toxin-antitoxin system VapC family toxin [Euryarchaeota archaeon]
MNAYKPKVSMDTSSIVKWFKAEEGSKEALKLRKWTEEGRIKLVISTILLSECARALKKAKWEDDEIYEVLDMLDTIIDLCGVDVIPADRLVVKSAQNLVVNYGPYSADAIHAATAILTASDYFVSSDEHHFKRDLKVHVEEKGVRILRLSEVEEIGKVIEKTHDTTTIK